MIRILGLIAASLALAVLSCANPVSETGGNASVVNETVLASAMVGDSSVELQLNLSWSESKSLGSKAIVNVSGAQLRLTDADSNPFYVRLSGTYNTDTKAVNVSGTAVFKATTGGTLKEYNISITGTYSAGKFSGKIAVNDLHGAETIEGAAAGSKTTITNVANSASVLRFTYVSDDALSNTAFDGRKGVLVLDGLAFSWVAQNGTYKEMARGTASQTGSDWNLVCSFVSTTNDGTTWTPLTAADYTATIDLTSPTKVLKIYYQSNPTPVGVMNVTELPSVVAIYNGTWQQTAGPGSDSGTFSDFVLYSDGKCSFHWEGTTGVTLSPTTGTWTSTTFSAPISTYWNGSSIASLSVSGTINAGRTSTSISGTWATSAGTSGTFVDP